MLTVCCKNQLKWHYALADSWFSSTDNMQYLHQTLDKYFILALKTNRLIVLIKEDKSKGRFTRIDSITWSKNPVQGWVKELKFSVLFHHQIFTNKDESTGTLYLISNDINAKRPLKQSIKKDGKWTSSIKV